MGAKTQRGGAAFGAHAIALRLGRIGQGEDARAGRGGRTRTARTTRSVKKRAMARICCCLFCDVNFGFFLIRPPDFEGHIENMSAISKIRFPRPHHGMSLITA